MFSGQNWPGKDLIKPTGNIKEDINFEVFTVFSQALQHNS